MAFTTSDKILKFIDEKGGRIKKVDIQKSHYAALGTLAYENLVVYPNENEVELTDEGRSLIETYKKFHKMAYRNLKL